MLGAALCRRVHGLFKAVPAIGPELDFGRWLFRFGTFRHAFSYHTSSWSSKPARGLKDEMGAASQRWEVVPVTEDEHRTLIARLAAHRYLIDGLLRIALQGMSEAERRAVIEELNRGLDRTEQISGVTKGNDQASERLADIFVQTQG